MIELTTKPLPELTIETAKKILTAEKAPIAGTTVPYIDITPDDRKLANQSKGAFNKKILTEVYKVNKDISLAGMNHRLSYGVNISGDHWFYPIGEYCDDSELFTFYGQASSYNSTHIQLDLGLDVPNATLIKYEEIILLHSIYFRNVDANGKPVDINLHNVVKTKLDETKFLDEIKQAELRIFMNYPWAADIDGSFDARILVNNFIREWENISSYDVSNNTGCLEAKYNLVGKFLNTMNWRYKVAPDQFTEEWWKEFYTKYQKVMLEHEIRPLIIVEIPKEDKEKGE